MHTGIDIGIKYTGVVTVDDNGKVLCHECFGSGINCELNKSEVRKNTAKRWCLYKDYLWRYFDANNITGTVVIEAPFNLSGDAKKLLELKGIYITVAGAICGTSKVYLLPPTTIKKFFTGSGIAHKDVIIAKCRQLGYSPPNDNYADAYAAAMCSVNNDISQYK